MIWSIIQFSFLFQRFFCMAVVSVPFSRTRNCPFGTIDVHYLCILCWVPNKSLSTFQREEKNNRNIFINISFRRFLHLFSCALSFSHFFVVFSRQNIRVRSISFKRYTNRDECGRFIFGTTTHCVYTVSRFNSIRNFVYVFFFGTVMVTPQTWFQGNYLKFIYTINFKTLPNHLWFVWIVLWCNVDILSIKCQKTVPPHKWNEKERKRNAFNSASPFVQSNARASWILHLANLNLWCWFEFGHCYENFKN